MLIDKKLLLFGGKGGVGKTSCAAATALYAASKGKKTLVLSTDPAHSLSDSLEKQVGDKETKIRENLYALELDAARLLKEYKAKYGELIKQIADEGTFFSKEDIQEFFDLSLPGMDEFMALIRIIDILEEDKYDLLILDTAPTGHTIRLLELPMLMTAYVRVLAEMRQKHRVVVSMMTGRYVKDDADRFIDKMHDDIERVKATLKGPDTRFVPITIPEAMSIYETERLVNTLERYGIPLELILVNRVMEEKCRFCKARHADQVKYLKDIKKRFSRYKVREIPLFANEVKGEALGTLAKILAGEKYTLPEPKSRKATNPRFGPLELRPGLRFLLFGGKGGVGKTSCACATALHESASKKTLIFSTDPAHSLSDSFGVEIGPEVTSINGNLDALEIDAYALLDELKQRYRREITEFFSSIFRPTAIGTIDVPYDRKVMTDLFDLCPPGIDEIMALKTMMDLIEDSKYDLFVLDTAPTGHTIRLLELPEIAEEWVRVLLDIQQKYPLSADIGETLGEMLDTIAKVRKMLAEGKETQFIAVTIPEAMGVLETQDLLASLRGLRVPAENLVINKIVPESSCSFCNAKRGEQLKYIKELKRLKLKTTGVELFDREIRGPDLEKLEEALFG